MIGRVAVNRTVTSLGASRKIAIDHQIVELLVYQRLNKSLLLLLLIHALLSPAEGAARARYQLRSIIAISLTKPCSALFPLDCKLHAEC